MFKSSSSAFRLSSQAIVFLGFSFLFACGNKQEPYKPQPAWTGSKPSLPTPPTLPTFSIKEGDAYTVQGAIHQLRSLVHSKEVTKDPITIVGTIVDSNIPRAPACAVHKTGKADPEGCTAEIPSFWVAENKDDSKGSRIRVVGWARNFSVIYDAMLEYGKIKSGESPKQLLKDDVLNADVPYPLPAVGAKVKVTGRYGVSSRVVMDLVSDPQNGVLTLQKMEMLEAAPESAQFSKNPTKK